MSAHACEGDGHAPSFLIVNAQVYAPSAPYATALYVSDGRVAWIGDQSGAEVHREIADVIVDARGNLMYPSAERSSEATKAGILYLHFYPGLTLPRQTAHCYNVS